MSKLHVLILFMLLNDWESLMETLVLSLKLQALSQDTVHRFLCLVSLLNCFVKLSIHADVRQIFILIFLSVFLELIYRVIDVVIAIFWVILFFVYIPRRFIKIIKLILYLALILATLRDQIRLVAVISLFTLRFHAAFAFLLDHLLEDTRP